MPNASCCVRPCIEGCSIDGSTSETRTPYIHPGPRGWSYLLLTTVPPSPYIRSSDDFPVHQICRKQIWGSRFSLSLCFPFVWLEKKEKPNLNRGDTT